MLADPRKNNAINLTKRLKTVLKLPTRPNVQQFFCVAKNSRCAPYDQTLFRVVLHCVKAVRIQSYSGPRFPAFGLNTDKIRIRIYGLE